MTRDEFADLEVGQLVQHRTFNYAATIVEVDKAVPAITGNYRIHLDSGVSVHCDNVMADELYVVGW